MKPAVFFDALNAIRAAGYEDDINWAENVTAPASPDAFAKEAIFVICNSGMRFTVAQGIYKRVMAALALGNNAGTVFGHLGKSTAIDLIWRQRNDLYLDWLTWSSKGPDKALEFCASLPWIGKITKFHLAKNFGVDVAKPDVHLQRLADHEGTSPQELCLALAAITGYRVNTIDVVLWRACAIGAINSRNLGA